MIKNKLNIIIILLLLLFLLFFNEFVLENFDKTPPLSDRALSMIRKINLLSITLSLYILLHLNFSFMQFINKKIFSFIKSLSFILILIIFLDSTLKFIGFGINKHWYNELNIRYPSTYDMFSNEPLVMDHNKLGFRGPLLSKTLQKSKISIAFLGGSTGYTGNPPIPEIISTMLTKNDINNVVYNFSSNSSNHNQHIHRLIKFSEYHFDIVIFYGGNNESIQYLQYDTRPSYPYNYFMINDISKLKLFLLKHSSIMGMFENYTGIISGINKERNYVDKNFDSWSDLVVNNYINTIIKAKNIFESSLTNNSCNKVIFLPILQPVNPRSSNEIRLWNKMIKRVNENYDILNYDDMRGIINFFDNVHIDQDSKLPIAKRISSDLIKLIKKNC
tara:strand:+ start:44 stop:1210 length:1167 start_codon:yes stop_codon:yes gene_type:complete